MMDDDTFDTDTYIPIWEVAVRYDFLRETREPLGGFELLLTAASDVLQGIRGKAREAGGVSEGVYEQTQLCLRMIEDAYQLAEYCPDANSKLPPDHPDRPLFEIGLRHGRRGRPVSV